MQLALLQRNSAELLLIPSIELRLDDFIVLHGKVGLSAKTGTE